MGKSCSVVKCVSGLLKDRQIRKSVNVKQASLFNIPKDPTLLAEWSSALKMKLSKKNFICDFHFKKEDIVKSARYEFPDGNSQTIEKERWTLVPNAVPINAEPRIYDYEFPEFQQPESSQHLDIDPCLVKNPTVEVQRPFIQFYTCKRKPSDLSENDSEKPKIINNADDLIPQESIKIDNLYNEESMDAKQGCSNTIDSNKSSMTLKEIQNFLNIPPAWYYICSESEMIFVHVDASTFLEKLRVYINEDMSVMVSFHQKKKIDFNLKISSPNDICKLFEDLIETSNHMQGIRN